MNPVVKYTLGRVGLFVGAVLVIWPVPIGLMVKLLLALTVSFLLSWFVLRGWRDELSAYLAARAEQRRGERERLRAALAGEDDPADPAPPPA